MLKRAFVAALILPVCAWAHVYSGTFSYYANGQDIKTVLSSFARSQGLACEMDSAVRARVSGNFQKVRPEDFLEAMREAYGLGVYVAGDAMHVYKLSDVRKEFMTVPSGSAEALLESLRRSGVVAEELPVAVNGDGSLMTIRGPQRYIDNLRTAADAYLAVQREKIVMRVFPIKYAWADDITLSNMDQSVEVPGIASILRGMVMGQSVAGSTVSEERGRPESAQSVPSLGADGLSKQKKPEAPSRASAGTPVKQGTISIMADPRVNAVLVSDAAYRMPYYEAVIRDLDKPVELVEIHAAIVDIDTDASRELGVNFSGKDGGGRWQGGGTIGGSNSGGFDDSGNPVIQTGTGLGGALISTIYTHGSDYFMARISALESENAARMLGRPSVLTVDNVQAVLENTTTYYIPLKGSEAVDLFKVESGTVLRVTPHVIRDEGKTSIKLAVSVQDDQNDAAGGYQSVGEDATGTITVSPIKQTKITTQAMVDAGQSLLIGGYYYEQKSDGTSGVPILKDIPLIGGLFRTNKKSGRQMERLILITPRIVTLGTGNVPARVDAPDFRRSATQPDYELRPELENEAGKKLGNDAGKDSGKR